MTYDLIFYYEYGEYICVMLYHLLGQNNRTFDHFRLGLSKYKFYHTFMSLLQINQPTRFPVKVTFSYNMYKILMLLHIVNFLVSI